MNFVLESLRSTQLSKAKPAFPALSCAVSCARRQHYMWGFSDCPALRNKIFHVSKLLSGHYYFIHETHFSHHESKLDLYAAMQHHSPVSSILLQENRIRARQTAGLFFYSPWCSIAYIDIRALTRIWRKSQVKAWQPRTGRAPISVRRQAGRKRCGWHWTSCSTLPCPCC